MEVQSIWPTPWRFNKVLFLVTRYAIFLASAFECKIVCKQPILMYHYISLSSYLSQVMKAGGPSDEHCRAFAIGLICERVP